MNGIENVAGHVATGHTGASIRPLGDIFDLIPGHIMS